MTEDPMKQSIDIITNVWESLKTDSEYYEAQTTISSVNGVNHALASICTFCKDKESNMAEVAALAFRLGVYMGLQYNKFDKMMK